MFSKKSRSLIVNSMGFHMAHIINEGALSIVHLQLHRKNGLINSNNAKRVIDVKAEHAKYYAR
ncbi:hypothetical protein NVP1005O_17 [Vibrio phage 1.005.O._10N.286.48.F2]|nr:hypothetical protein NVP1005O_17 [Vibrio phage 1.005.O._10N.286.48.F2]